MKTASSVSEDPWKARWSDLFPVQRDVHVKQAYDRLRQLYAEPHRAYHTFDHVTAFLRHLDRSSDDAGQLKLIELALWYHDVIYDPKAQDNEERSAQFAVQELSLLGISDADLTRVRRLIEVTRHPSVPKDDDEALLLDIDLAILGAPAPHYDRYEMDVRQEYSWVPSPLYCAGRSKLLTSFLAEPAIYRTPAFLASHEEQARENMQRAIANLAGHRT